MTPVFVLAAIAGVPVLLGLLTRVHAAFLFLSIATGSLLVNYVGDDAAFALRMVMRGENTAMITQFALLLVPVVLTLLFMRKTMPKSKVLLNVPVLLACGLALAVLALPYFDSNAQEKIFTMQYGDVFKDAQDTIVATVASFSLLLLWLTARHKEEKHGKFGKKHKK